MINLSWKFLLKKYIKCTTNFKFIIEKNNSVDEAYSLSKTNNCFSHPIILYVLKIFLLKTQQITFLSLVLTKKKILYLLMYKNL